MTSTEDKTQGNTTTDTRPTARWGHLEVKYLCYLLIILTIADAWLTNLLINIGMAVEGNPLLIGIAGEPRFLIFKISGVLLATIFLWDLHRRFPKLAVLTAFAFVMIYGGIVSWNLHLFY
jgi:hypothetical protein